MIGRCFPVCVWILVSATVVAQTPGPQRPDPGAGDLSFVNAESVESPSDDDAWVLDPLMPSPALIQSASSVAASSSAGSAESAKSIKVATEVPASELDTIPSPDSAEVLSEQQVADGGDSAEDPQTPASAAKPCYCRPKPESASGALASRGMRVSAGGPSKPSPQASGANPVAGANSQTVTSSTDRSLLQPRRRLLGRLFRRLRR